MILIPIFKCFAFTEENVMACNDTLAITSPCVTDMAFCVHGETLKGLLENSHSETVEFSIKDDDLDCQSREINLQAALVPG